MLLLLLAFALRTWELDRVPPGLTHDEASNGHDSAAILRGVHRLYFPVGYGHEPLYNYSVAAMMGLLGQRIFTLRLTTVLWSTATWVLTVALCRRWWGRQAALLGGAALAVGFWPLMMARVGLRAPTLPALLTASALSYDHALAASSRSKGRLRAAAHYGLAGLLLGASFYTYMASRGMPALYLAFLVALAVWDRATLRRAWAGTLAVVAIAGLVGLPLFLHLRAHPELEQRIAQLGGALIALRAGDVRPLWRNVRASLPMLLWRADPRWLYNVGGRAALAPATAAAFLVGTALALARLRDRRHLFVLLWLAGGMAPALLAPVDYNTLHAIAAQPAIYLLVGRGLAALWAAARATPRALRFTRALIVLALALTGVEAAHAYFGTWAQHRDVRVLYHHHVVTLGRHLEADPAPGPVVVTSLYPGEYHDPYVMEVTRHGRPQALRWVDGRSALFFPGDPARLYIEPQSLPHPTLQALVDATAVPYATLTFRADDIPPAVHGYRWDADAAWEALTSELMPEVHIALHDGPPSPYNADVPCPIAYGATVALVGHRVTPPVAEPGATVEVLTAWRVLREHPQELVLFTHLLNDDNHLVAQRDRLDAPAWQWQPGDRFVQLHTYPLPPDLPPGSYGFAVGLYRRADAVRLPVASEFGAITRALLPFDVAPAEQP